MAILKVTRFIQDPAYCAVAACAALSNYYNRTITYESTKALADSKYHNISKEGLSSPEMGLLLNEIGFRYVSVISCQLDFLDMSWAKMSKKELLSTLTDAKKKRADYRQTMADYIAFLENDVHNKLIIDWDFGSYIMDEIKAGRPLISSYNWTMFFKFSKYSGKKVDPINGVGEEHAVVINGCDNNGVNIVDSHNEYYKYSLKKYRKGRYKIKWNNMMTIIGEGDLIIAHNHDLV